ncbi:MAG: TOMM precursor leader peptide-binding protein [Acidobacteriia bacterium]|nr:TOMM precursor leader peptide-binding protein [Terriglobia bacterium]
MTNTLPADRGVVEVPVLAPHLEFRLMGQQEVLIVSEARNALIHGEIYASLLPLLDGRRSQGEITVALAGAHSESQVRSALAALSSRGYVMSGEYAMEHGRAAFWSSLGASPRWAEERLRTASVEVAPEDSRLVRQLGAMGVAIATDDPTLSIVVCDDYLDERLAEVNRLHIASGVPWMLAVPKGMHPLFGPIFRPAERGPCWSCLAYRLRGHQEVHNFLRNLGGADAAFVPSAGEPGVLDLLSGLVAVEVAKWLVLGEAAPLHSNAISLDLAQLECEHHPTQRRPQCFECGDEALYRADRPPVPIRLQPSPKAVRNSGGLRSLSPEQTLSKYRHLVSPVSGVVTWLRRSTDETDSWLHVHSAGSNFALRSRALSTLRRSLRAKSAGKGSTSQQSKASAMCEAIERYCCAFHGDEIRRRLSYSEFEGSGSAEAIHPNEVQLFSDWQLDHSEEINARGHPLNHVPARLDLNAEIDWSPVWSLTQQRHRYLPTSILYAAPPELRDGADLKADTNGCAAGNTLEEAILQGFYELVERDAFAIWWYNRLSLPKVDLASFDDSYLADAPEYYARLSRELWVLDATSDLGVPTFVAVSRRTDKEEQDIIYGAGAHADPRIAALRAVCEMNQFLDWVQFSGAPGSEIEDPMSLEWWKNARIEDNPWLAPDCCRSTSASDYSIPDTADLKEDVERSQLLVEAKGMELLVLDQTRPDIGMPVARVIVPGLRHFWERFAPGRLFDVPLEMGLREERIAEADLNPAPVTI